jgi:hypothetical protein
VFEPPHAQPPLDLSSQSGIVYGARQPSGNGFILGTITVLGLAFLYLVGLFYDGVGALFSRPPTRVMGIALAVTSLSFVAIHDGPAHGGHWLLSTTVSPALGVCCVGLWSRHRTRQDRRAQGIPSAWQAERDRVARDLGSSVNRNAGHLKHWWASL